MTVPVSGTTNGRGQSSAASISQDFSAWIGRSVEAVDRVVAAPLTRLAATLDHDGAHWPKDVLPPLGHWLFHLPDAVQSQLGPDGHPARGGFLPPIAQPRRMWAGGRLTFEHSIPIGATLTKRSTVQAIDAHRIHYDLSYAPEVELYAGLVVHGPLQAMLLMTTLSATVSCHAALLFAHVRRCMRLRNSPLPGLASDCG